ncbi:MAG: LPS biosynthesis protein [Clostridia bacterium]
MEIDHNPIERRPMEAFHCGDRAEGLRIQEEFAAMFREEYREKIAVPEGCRYHGNYKECVAIHRAHQEHVPNCLCPMLNRKIKALFELTEHTFAHEIEPPQEILRKE